MKKVLFIFIHLLLITSCEEVIEVDLASDTGRLVIEAKVERVHDVNGEIIDDVLVNLSLTTSFYENTPNYVNDAEITLTNLNSNATYNLSNINDNGQYTILPSTDFEIRNDIEYVLTVIYNEEIYKATEILNISTPIDYAIQYKESEGIIEPEDVAINITFTDIEDTENYYIFGFNNTNFLATDDEFTIDGEPFNFNYFYEDPPSENLIIFLYGSDKRTNEYVDSIEELSEGGSNGPFSTVPYEVKGNIVNTTNADNYPYGYFRINEVYFTQIDLVDNEEAPSINEVERIIKEDQETNTN